MARRSSEEVLPDGVDIRDHLLASAEACFARYGIVKTTMEDIAREAGVYRPLIYKHFSDRDNLILAVMVQRAGMIIDRAHTFMRQQPTFADRLVEGLLFSVQHGRNDPYVRLLVSPEHMDLANRIAGASEKILDLTMALWEPILREAVESGEARPDLDIRRACRWIVYQELVLVGRLDVVDNDLDEVRALLREFVVPVFTNPAVAAPGTESAPSTGRTSC